MSGDIPVSEPGHIATDPIILGLSNTYTVVAWTDYGTTPGDFSHGQILAQIFFQDGSAITGIINLGSTGNDTRPALAATTNAGFVVTYQASTANGVDILQQTFNSKGVAQGDVVVLNSITAGDQVDPGIAAYTGGFAAVWESADTTLGAAAGDHDIYLRLENSSGVAQGTEILVNSDVVAGNQHNPQVASLTGGGFVVIWETGSGGISAQRYDSSGAKAGSVITIGSSAASYEYPGPNIAATKNGGFVIAWSESGGSGAVKYQAFDASGNVLSSGTSSEQGFGSVAAGAGQFALPGSFTVLGTQSGAAGYYNYNGNGVLPQGAVSLTGSPDPDGIQYSPAMLSNKLNQIFYAWIEGGAGSNGAGQVYMRDTSFGVRLSLLNSADTSKIFDGLTDAIVTDHSGTQLVMANTDTSAIYTLTGQFGDFDGNGLPQSGTITGYQLADAQGNATAKITQMGFNVPAFLQFIANQDITGMENTLYSSVVSIAGSPGDDIIYPGDQGSTINGGAGIDTVIVPFDGTISWSSISGYSFSETTGVGLVGGQLINIELARINGQLERLTTSGKLVPVKSSNDFNADGKSDILLQNSDGTAAVWLMSGATLTGGGVIGSPGSSDWKAIGDGSFGYSNSDVLWQNSDGTVAIWNMNNITPQGGGILGNPGANWTALAAADFDGNGGSDVLFRAADGTIAVWLLTTVNDQFQIGGGVVGNPGAGWDYKGTGDFDGDGKADILFQNVDGSIAIWQMNGATIAGGGVVGNPGGTWQAKAVGDFDGDGKADILFQDDSGQVAIWLMNGTAIAGGGIAGNNTDPNWVAESTGDYNADGNSDILFQNTDGSAAIWLMNGTTVTNAGLVGSNPGVSWHVVAG